MGTVRLQATVQEFDIPYLERFLKGISATEINFEKEEDAFDILTPEDLKAIALSKEQGNLGMVTSNDDVFKETLEFWDIHNGSYLFSDKILLETEKLMLELSNNTLYLGRYNKTLNLYVRPILKGRYFIYFEVKNNGKEDFIEIQYFRSSKQQPIS